MQNIRMTLQYDGTRYLGWQRPEKNGASKTISYKITEILKKVTAENITVHAGARTEPHVHALAQTVSFQTSSGLSPEHLARLLNQYLPRDIAVLDATAVQERFRADLNARFCTYEYRICTSPVYDIFTRSFSTHLFPAPDIQNMERAASLLIGSHDFTPFSGQKKKKKTEKSITEISFLRNNNTTDETIILLTANTFLYLMPSLIIGTLLEIGTGNRSPECISDIFAGREKAGVLCDPRGLLLKEIIY